MASHVVLGIADNLMARTDRADPHSAMLLPVRDVRAVCRALRAEHDSCAELISAILRVEKVKGNA